MNEWTKEEWECEKSNATLSFLYIYTPMCGTCQIASKMMQVIEAMVPFPIGQANINYMKNLAEDYEIESVPCLLIMKKSKIQKKVYAFQSVPYLLDVIKSIDELEMS